MILLLDLLLLLALGMAMSSCEGRRGFRRRCAGARRRRPENPCVLRRRRVLRGYLRVPASVARISRRSRLGDGGEGWDGGGCVGRVRHRGAVLIAQEGLAQELLGAAGRAAGGRRAQVRRGRGLGVLRSWLVHGHVFQVEYGVCVCLCVCGEQERYGCCGGECETRGRRCAWMEDAQG